MEIRPVRADDLSALLEIDGTIESSYYLHVERTGEALATHWKLEQRPLRQKLVDRNRPTDENEFHLKQIVTGIEEGMALLAEHDEQKVALLIAQEHSQYGTMNVIDLRVDFDHRRQGLASAMLYQVIAEARNRELRAMKIECHTGNLPANRLFAKLGFDLGGIDTQRHTNHDLVKEAATLFWYAALD